MGNVLSEEKQQQVLALGRLGWSLRRIEDSTGVRRETASSYLKDAGIPVRGPRQVVLPAKPATTGSVSTDPAAQKPASSEWASADPTAPKPASSEEVSTDPATQKGPCQAPTASECEPYRDEIEQALRLGRNAMAIYQDLVTQYGFASKYASVKRFVRKVGAGPESEAHPVIHTVPGEEGQVDYGQGPMVRHPGTGKYVRTRLFVFTLAHSRKSVRLLAFKSSSQIWAELHERAFRQLGGTTRTVVLDNLREGVLKPDVYDPTLNPVYADMLKHYGATALPCKVGHPDRKGKVESGVGHAQRTPLRGLRFETLEAAQRYLDEWEERWADTRIHGTMKRQVAAMFAEERPFLQPLPVEPFRQYQYGDRTVHLDGHLEVEGAYYCAPPGMIGRTLPVQWDGRRVRLLDARTRQLLIEYEKKPRGSYSTPEEYRPPRTPQTTLQLLSHARLVGKYIGELCQEIHRADGETGVKRILGVRALIRQHGAPVVEHACQAALEMGVPTYRFVKHYLDHRPRPALELRQIDPLIRELTHYRDTINRMTQEPTDEPR
jgi:transposase